jgi:cytochrome c biogenesis protein CcmG/thiol:disulfide interchange protein DsbE
MTRSRDSRREAARAREKGGSSSRLLLPIVGIGIVLVAAIAAIVLTSGSGSGGGAASTAPPTSSAGASPGAVPPGTAPVITGTSLPVFEDTAGDPAVGLTIPEVDGADFAGNPVAIDLDGKPKVLLFLAHWCGHCQAEVPVVQDWIDSGAAPTDIEVISVATAIDDSLPNYPPDEWLEREGWTVPVIVDPTTAVSQAYGLNAYPYWVFVDGEGKVTGRLTGELPIADLETILATIR